ncbi:hypothetical protein M9Y10_028853 [Tritrichomonas musculus]|uniref:Mitochondrial import inner membrane translocase subunit TIM50 n=1 Tax=Tritrichomonas musculus TaxID=1915356 RepID=A0ABR2KKK3_9EUKA
MQNINDLDLSPRDRIINITMNSHSIEQEKPEEKITRFNVKIESNTQPDSFLNKRYSIVFDLDNTLIYTTPLQTKNTSFVVYQQKSLNCRTRSSSSIRGTMQISLLQKGPPSESKINSVPNNQTSRNSMPRGTYRKFFVQTRPKLHEFLRSIIKEYNIFFYTASEREYAKDVVSKIFEETFSAECLKNQNDEDLTEFRNYMSNLDKIIFSREHCTFMNGYELKDLRLLNKPLSDIILVDDIQGSGLLQPLNSLIIPAFYGDVDDLFLTDELLPLLTQCSKTKELIPNIRKYAETLSPHLMLYDQ